MDKLKSAATRAAGEKTAGVRVPSKKTVVAVVIFALLALAFGFLLLFILGRSSRPSRRPS